MAGQRSHEIDDICVRHPTGLPAIVRFDLKTCVVAALPMDDHSNVIADQVDDDLVDQEPDDLLLRLDSRAGGIPCLCQILSKGQQTLAIDGTERFRRPLCKFGKVFLKCTHCCKPLIPSPFQLVGDEPVIGIDSVELPLRPSSLELRCLQCTSICRRFSKMLVTAGLDCRKRCLAMPRG